MLQAKVIVIDWEDFVFGAVYQQKARTRLIQNARAEQRVLVARFFLEQSKVRISELVAERMGQALLSLEKSTRAV